MTQHVVLISAGIRTSGPFAVERFQAEVRSLVTFQFGDSIEAFVAAIDLTDKLAMRRRLRTSAHFRIATVSGPVFVDIKTTINSASLVLDSIETCLHNNIIFWRHFQFYFWFLCGTVSWWLVFSVSTIFLVGLVWNSNLDIVNACFGCHILCGYRRSGDML